MRKLSNIWPGFLAVLVNLMLITIISCDKSTEPEPKPEGTIIGSWQMVTIIMYDTPVGDLTIPAATFLELSETGATSSLLQFNEDGTAAVITTYQDAPQDTIDGTWSADGDQMSVQGAGIDTTVTFKVDGDTMSLTRTMPINLTPEAPKEDIVVKMVYSRVK